MRSILVALVFSAVAVRAVPTPMDPPNSLTDQERVEKDHVIVSSGPFKYAEKDHPKPDKDGNIVGTGEIGKSTYLSTQEFLEGTNQQPNPKRNYDITRPSSVAAQGLEAKADAGTPMKNGEHVPPGHVSVGIPRGQETTVDAMKEKMQKIQAETVRAKGEKYANQIISKANEDPSKPLKDAKAEVDTANKPPPPQNSKKGKKDRPGGAVAGGAGGVDTGASAGGNGGGSEGAGGSDEVPTECKRDGSFCTLRSRPKMKEAGKTVGAKTVVANKAAGPKGNMARKTGNGGSPKPSTARTTTAGGSKKQTFIAPKVSKGSSKANTGSAVAKLALKSAKKIHRRDLLMSRPQWYTRR